MIAAREKAMSKTPRILILEDMYFVADGIKRAVQEIGAEVVGPTPKLEKAMDYLEKRAFDLALLDVNLGEETAYPFAAALDEVSIPYIFVTGYDPKSLREEFQGRPVLEKPITVEGLRSAVQSRLAQTELGV
jgi:two-component SAPR family response regulator